MDFDKFMDGAKKVGASISKTAAGRAQRLSKNENYSDEQRAMFSEAADEFEDLHQRLSDDD